MRIAIASSHSFDENELQPFRLPLTRLLPRLAAAVVLLAGCGTSNTAPDADDTTAYCMVDLSVGPTSAISDDGTAQIGEVCPRGDVDWYTVTVPAGMDLLDVSAAMPGSITRVDLAVQLYAADGTTPIANGAIADGTPDDAQTSITSTLSVRTPGTYLLALRDLGDDEKDDLNTYVLNTAMATDPDTHEPNDDASMASTADGQPGWFAYQGDVDVYSVNVPGGSSLLHTHLDTVAGAPYGIAYEIDDASGATVATGEVAPGVPVDIVRPLAGSGNYTVALRESAGSAPDRVTADSYTASFDTLPELDPNESPVRNDTAATPTCLGGGTGTCGTPFTGSPVTYPAQTGRVGSTGDRDVYRLDATGGIPAIVDISATLSGSAAIQLAVDILVPDPNSTCTADAECGVINVPCAADTDCEMSHICLAEQTSAFCPGGGACRLCQGASVCIPSTTNSSGPKACGVTQFTKHDTTGSGTVRTAQPILTSGPMYVVVHDFKDDEFAYNTAYTLNVGVSTEPDPNDSVLANRNNFYNPYPTDMDDLSPQAMRAVDIDATLRAGNWIDGYLSYEADQDWYSFLHPCPGADCGLQFEFVQPGPSPVHPVWLMVRQDLQLHESFTYNGAVPTSGPITDTFGDGDCHECSFANASHGGGDPTYRYYFQVRDLGADDWDHTGVGQYRFRLASVTSGCPASCSEYPGGMCTCYCAAEMSCPASP